MSSTLHTLSADEITAWLQQQHLAAWAFTNNALTRSLPTQHWQHTMHIANGISALAEAAQHHPQLTLNFHSIDIMLTTHDCGGGVTARDFSLAAAIDAWWQLNAQHLA
jgi:4a-hydroxytetrahydrobiopterin dehydratase